MTTIDMGFYSLVANKFPFHIFYLSMA